MEKTATLTYEDKTIELPVIIGTEGEIGIDIRELRAKTGMISFDPGFGNTGSCASEITFINGEEGKLTYRGIPIEQFNQPKPDFMETCYLVVFGHLPNKEELNRFKGAVNRNDSLNESMKHHFEGFPSTAHPMAILSAMLNTLVCFHPEMMKLEDMASFEEASARLISKIKNIAAFSYRRSRGLPYMYPNPGLDYCADFMHMMFSMPYSDWEYDQDIVDALNMIFILHADHEQNCSTSTVRMVGSSQANLFASCAAGVAALWGPLHGGANLAVIQMLDEIYKGGTTPEECIAMAKDKDSDFKLMGFGHRVYKNRDPRAEILKGSCDKIFAKMGKREPILDIAKKLEELALEDSYFKERKLFPNVDFYSGIIMRALGIPTNMFTVMFAIGRLPGWISQWKEHNDTPGVRISRPRQIYTGKTNQDYIPLDKR
jgi:citrate synthase